MNILVSSGGRRVGLIKCLRESQTELGLKASIVAIDATPLSSTAYFADTFYTVPPCADPSFTAALTDICTRENIGLIIPAIDNELPLYASVSEEFHTRGITIAVSGQETVAICRDKNLTHGWFSAHGFPVPRQATPLEILANPGDWSFPIIVKPVTGSASAGVRVLHSRDDLAVVAESGHDLIAQEFLGGNEFTVNVFVNRRGKCVCAVPHLRMEVRGGEVSKAVTVKHLFLIETVTRIIETLPDAYGPLNVQCFLDSEGDIRFTEINARFGGGYPLAHMAGARITTWLLQDALGLNYVSRCDDWQDGLLMLRYDEAVYSQDAGRAEEQNASPLLCRSAR